MNIYVFRHKYLSITYAVLPNTWSIAEDLFNKTVLNL